MSPWRWRITKAEIQGQEQQFCLTGEGKLLKVAHGPPLLRGVTLAKGRDSLTLHPLG